MKEGGTGLPSSDFCASEEGGGWGGGTATVSAVVASEALREEGGLLCLVRWLLGTAIHLHNREPIGRTYERTIPWFHSP